MAHERAHVVFSGRVQGVGFRFNSRSVARRFVVTGYVRNLRDGTVELEAQGESSDVDAFLLELRATMADYVSAHQVTWVELATGESAFTIRF